MSKRTQLENTCAHELVNYYQLESTCTLVIMHDMYSPWSYDFNCLRQITRQFSRFFTHFLTCLFCT